jgi:hypothetical protein
MIPKLIPQLLLGPSQKELKKVIMVCFAALIKYHKNKCLYSMITNWSVYYQALSSYWCIL